jgi:Acetyltransferase (GNAT) domain
VAPCAELIQRIASGWPEEGGLWVVEWAHEPGFLGWCGIFPLEDSGLLEIGYRYVRGAWGQGVGTEAACAVLDHGFRVLGLDLIVAVAHPEKSRVAPGAREDRPEIGRARPSLWPGSCVLPPGPRGISGRTRPQA